MLFRTTKKTNPPVTKRTYYPSGHAYSTGFALFLRLDAVFWLSVLALLSHSNPIVLPPVVVSFVVVFFRQCLIRVTLGDPDEEPMFSPDRARNEEVRHESGMTLQK